MSRGHATVVGPRDDWRRAIDAARAGDEVALAPGRYLGGLAVTRGGHTGQPVIIRALDASERPMLTPSGAVSYLLDIRADDVVIRGLSLPPTRASVHGIILRGASRVTVEDCKFEGLGGLAIVETMTACDVVIRRNEIRNSRTTAMYFGCHSGSCVVSNLVIENNYIENVTAPLRTIGYGIQVKLNSSATIRGNVIFGTKGPGIMVYGTEHGQTGNRVERNVTIGSRRSSGVVIGGGPAIVRDNVAAGNAVAGITVEDYADRHLLRAIEVCGNTVYGNRRGGIRVDAAHVDAVIAGNVVDGRRSEPQTLSDAQTR